MSNSSRVHELHCATLPCPSLSPRDCSDSCLLSQWCCLSISPFAAAFSSCLYCCVWSGLSVFWQFVLPFYCEGSSLWVVLDRWLVKVSWLGKLVSVFWWVELDFFSLECNEVSSNEFWDVSGFGETSGSLYIEAQGYVPVLLENLHGMSCSGTCWPLSGAWFQCRYRGIWWAPIN